MPELVGSVVHRLRAAGQTVSVAESCTGGALGEALTAPPGASDVFWGGVIAYANDAKQELLGVDQRTIHEQGSVSSAVGVAMATGMRRLAGTHWSVAITGIAGPGGATPGKPVGTVWIAVDGDRPEVRGYALRGGRAEIKRQAVEAALRLLEEQLGRPDG